ncbi:hypothetical protein GCM10010267_49110 [Streptomyces griseorubens]|nr:hypothetical protein GCM10010267_49110 [Streptomyces griseorubens]
MNRRRQKKLARKLVEAVMFGEVREVDALLRAGADPDGRDADGTTPLYAASVHGATDKVRRSARGRGLAGHRERPWGSGHTPVRGRVLGARRDGARPPGARGRSEPG